ncbi:MAG: hypothetical protein C0628_06105 [Sulfurimonas sp.]|nr:MAG: hypothetical protein C0628_06105 [Sulfurimonas sp.]
MKTFFIILTFLTLFTGCSRKNAFFEFNMDKDQELSATSIQSSKIVSRDGETQGVISVIYLNEIYPKLYNQNEYFFVFLFTKEAKEIYNPNKSADSNLKLKLNSKLPIEVEQLPEENKFSHLVNSKNNWNSYYLITFEKTDTINLLLEDNVSSSKILHYESVKSPQN